jgi:hypothetical protein
MVILKIKIKNLTFKIIECDSCHSNYVYLMNTHTVPLNVPNTKFHKNVATAFILQTLVQGYKNFPRKLNGYIHIWQLHSKHIYPEHHYYPLMHFFVDLVNALKETGAPFAVRIRNDTIEIHYPDELSLVIDPETDTLQSEDLCTELKTRLTITDGTKDPIGHTNEDELKELKDELKELKLLMVQSNKNQMEILKELEEMKEALKNNVLNY